MQTKRQDPPTAKDWTTQYHKVLQDDSHRLPTSAGRYPDTKFRFNKDFAIRPDNFSFLKPIIPPWSRCSIQWNIFKQEFPGLSIFTDGSKMNGKVGGAFVVYNHKSEVHHQCFRLSDNPTVYLAELLAIKRATEYAILNGLSNVNIISDSRSVLLAMENVNNIDAEIRGIKNRIKDHPGNITLHWVKAHVGHIGNERADELAKAATQNRRRPHGGL
ncbi:retrovirus-related Pol polyprotein from type-1 retrotransposable element R1 4 [Caerostris darwini]|uniref:ribonuclease H n=1 Tax=Caerostris darwini TaxID=1538125 RepID=A0AAV4MXW2_9ARAC|nr:retrovirus-related Pol polyprotein from type-1 retrotransposable element R1 4 [Caerostris darwini]